MPTLLVACFFAAALASADALQTQRSLVFLGGPLVFLAGLFARTEAYLHAPQRITLLPLPIPLVGPASHARSARTDHVFGIALTAMLGVGAILGATAPQGLSHAIWLVSDFVWLALFFMVLEPLVPGIGAFYGRRFSSDHPASATQRALGGGWTQAEAVVHLYGPAIIVGLATACAMPGQLSLDRLSQGASLTPNLLALSLVPLGCAAISPWVGRALYRRGAFEAIPWLAQATRSLSGPPTPEPAPGWALRIQSPVRRLLVVQFLRATPLPMFRLVLLVGFGLIALVRAEPSAPWIALAVGTTVAWVLPALRLHRRVHEIHRRLLAPLPLPEQQAQGRDLGATMMLVGPAVAVLVLAGLGMAM